MKKQKIHIPNRVNSPVRKVKNEEYKLESYIKLFDAYLENQRGIVKSTRQKLCRIGSLFLQTTFRSKPLCLSQIRIIDIQYFIEKYARHGSPPYIRDIASSLRTFLRFLRVKGLVAVDFSPVVPHVAIWKKDRIPEFLTAHEVKELLKGCDKDTSIGLRDYTVLRLILSLGLRAFEVSNLTLEDLEWHNGIIVIHGKGSKISHLPLTQELGDDLVTYLLKARPSCISRRFFVSICHPFHGLNPLAISQIVGRALKRVGLKKKGKAHLLRHTLATSLLNKGASLQEVGQVLRHQSIDTTTIYAKVDFERLRPLALPWLGNLEFGGPL